MLKLQNNLSYICVYNIYDLYLTMFKSKTPNIMKKLLLITLLSVSLFSCSKSEDSDDLNCICETVGFGAVEKQMQVCGDEIGAGMIPEAMSPEERNRRFNACNN